MLFSAALEREDTEGGTMTGLHTGERMDGLMHKRLDGWMAMRHALCAVSEQKRG